MTGNKPSDDSTDKPDFNTESPDAGDPQVDPVKPAKTPAKEHGTKDDYPPYESDK
ncbi:DUF6021 family protein [Pseudomonas syringae]|uniref:DUF6021 family protein n=1 Tax=Pseudomonas syringae TaxID=317 RepID=UPI003F75310E